MNTGSKRFSEKQKMKNSIFIIAFFLISLGPYALRLGAPANCFLDENRAISHFPIRKTYSEFFPAFEQYFMDREPYRTSVLNLCRRINAQLNPTSSESVIIDRKGFIYLNKFADNPTRQLRGKSLVREYLIAKTARNIQNFYRQYLAPRNIRLFIVIPPDKIAVYFDQLPPGSRYLPVGLCYAERLKRKLAGNQSEINVLLLRDELSNAREKLSYPVFRRADTHWNQLGGYIGARTLIQAINPHVKMPVLEDKMIQQGSKCLSEDLVAIGHLKGAPVPDYDFQIAGVAQYCSAFDPRTDGKDNQQRDFVTINEKAPDPSTILMYRDSFAIALIPFISAHFRKVRYIWGDRVTRAQIEETNPDIVIFEKVNRGMRNIVNSF